jgi:glucose uptake protein GlcU
LGLSDKEREVLEELERQLTGGTTKAKPEQPISRVQYARLLVIGSLLVVFGLVLLVFSTTIQAVWLGVLAFILMLAGLFFVSQNWSSKALKSEKIESKPKQNRESYFQKRWDERNK